jgi:hypothetical protein
LEELRKIFGPQVKSSEPHDGPAYRVTGGLDSLIKQAAPVAELLFITQELGTYGPVRNVHALREENRWHHFGPGTLDHATKRTLKEVFNPDDEKWRAAVLRHGGTVLEQALKAI